MGGEKAEEEEEYMFGISVLWSGSKSASGIAQPRTKRRTCCGVTTASSTPRTTSRPTQPTDPTHDFSPCTSAPTSSPLFVPVLEARRIFSIAITTKTTSPLVTGRIHISISLPYPSSSTSHHYIIAPQVSRSSLIAVYR